jgi:competence ComEA-like helix-hairpin-helix protein
MDRTRSVLAGIRGAARTAHRTLVDRTLDDLLRVAPVARRWQAEPAQLGSAIVFRPVLDPVAVAFFVPFAVSVLLLGLGSDYNVFLVGRIWKEAKRLPLREAVEVASTGAARSIATAGVVLAGSFGLLGLVPLTTFHAIALTMVIGLLLDAFLVRQLLVPAMIVLVGPVSGWPGRRLGRPPTAPEHPPAPGVGSRTPDEPLPVGINPPPGRPVAGGAAGTRAAGAASSKVKLNTANVEELTTLPGIGPVTAHNIIDWRTANGRFTSVDQLLEVSGISDAKLAQLEGLVRH